VSGFSHHECPSNAIAAKIARKRLLVGEGNGLRKSTVPQKTEKRIAANRANGIVIGFASGVKFSRRKALRVRF
jgi:hypothetical protein